MSEVNKSWAADAFDAIRITMLNGEFKIEGTDGNQVELEGDADKRFAREAPLEPADRWLPLTLWSRHGDSDFTLRLPRSKAWVVELSAPQAEVEVRDIQARLGIRLGKGEVRVENCRGQFAIAAGRGDVEFKRCTEAEMPEAPAFPQGEHEHTGGPIPPFPPMPPMPEDPAAFFGFRHGPRMEMKMNPKMRMKFHIAHGHDEPDEDWEDWNGEEWARWGEEIGERAAAWAEGFVSQIFGQFGGFLEKKGVSMQLGRGDIKAEDIEAKDCTIRIASGDVELNRGRIDNLSLETSHGDVQCERILPTHEWDIELRHGDISLHLPSETRARLDVATRHGDINSQVPLVRVNRPGRESRHGGRMVGTAGPNEGTIAQISLTTLRGDIDIEGPKGDSVRREWPAEAAVPTPPPPPPAPSAGRASDVPAAPVASAPPTTGGRAEDVPSTPTTGGRAEDVPAKPQYDSQVAILRALAEGKISVAEAEQLLRSLR